MFHSLHWKADSRTGLCLYQSWGPYSYSLVVTKSHHTTASHHTNRQDNTQPEHDSRQESDLNTTNTTNIFSLTESTGKRIMKESLVRTAVSHCSLVIVISSSESSTWLHTTLALLQVGESHYAQLNFCKY